jgi:uncharacterized protein (TIGR04222 family)
MTPTDHELYRRICEITIGDGDHSFESRLARENGWDSAYAQRVVAEYRRFLFLAAISAQPVCPSEDVDAAWHLHLLYTRSYWTHLCGEVLGRPLHHDPSRGAAETDHHIRMYARTLAAYQTTFGTEPPADVWPPVETRFGDDLAHRVVNMARNWIVPKRPIKRIAKLVAASLAVAVLVPGCAGGGWNPFDLVGVEYLGFLIPMMLVAILAGRFFRWLKRTPGPQPGDDEMEPTWEQAAYLTGGYSRLTTAAIARLVESGAAVVSGNRSRIDRVGLNTPRSLSPVEAAVYQRLPLVRTSSELRAVESAVRWAFADEASRLEKEGFMLSLLGQFALVCTAAFPLMFVLIVFGIPRLLMGLVNGRPVEYLIITLAFGGLLGTLAAVVGPFRLTRRGDSLVARLRAEHNGLRSGPVKDAALTVALFGTTALAGSSLADLQAWYPRPTTSGSSGGCGTSTCGGGGGGGGCGGGGGGCGGCGGG